MTDQLKDVQIILQGHIQTEEALGTANKKDVSNFEYLITLIKKTLLENTEEKRNRVFGTEIGSIDEKFFNSIIISIQGITRIPPRDQKVMFDFIGYCNKYRTFFNGIPQKPINEAEAEMASTNVEAETAKLKEKEVDTTSESEKSEEKQNIKPKKAELELKVIEEEATSIDIDNPINEKISKRIIEYYKNEINELSVLISTNLLIITQLERKNKPTDKVKKVIAELTDIKKYYEDTIESISENPLTEILYLDQWDKRNPEKITTFSKKNLKRNTSINAISKELSSLSHEELLLLEEKKRNERLSFFSKVKLNAVQNKIVRLKSKRGKIIIKQRFIVIEKAKEQLKSTVARRKKLEKISIEHYEYVQKQLAKEKAEADKRDAKSRQGKVIDKLLSLFSGQDPKEKKDVDTLRDRIRKTRRKQGKMSEELIEKLDKRTNLREYAAQNAQLLREISLDKNFEPLVKKTTTDISDSNEAVNKEVVDLNSLITGPKEDSLIKESAEEKTAQPIELGIGEVVSLTDLTPVVNPKLSDQSKVNSAETFSPTLPEIGESINLTDLTAKAEPIAVEKPKVESTTVEAPKVVPATPASEINQSLPDSKYDKLGKFKYAIIRGWQAYNRELENQRNGRSK